VSHSQHAGGAGRILADVVLLTTLKFVAFLWLGGLAAGITLLTVLYLGDLLTRVIQQRFPGRR